MHSEKRHYSFYAGCCFQGADAHFVGVFKEVMKHLDAELHVLEQGLCCGSGVIEERSELSSLAINARNLALAEDTGMPLFIPCATCFNVLANCRDVLSEDAGLLTQVNAILAAEGLQYRGSGRLTHPLWAIAVDLGLDKLADKVVTPLTGLRVATFYGCHLRNPTAIQSYEPSDNLRSLENILCVLGADIVQYESSEECCGYHLNWPNNALAMKMTSNVLCGLRQSQADVLVTPCPLCFKNLDGAQRQALAASNADFQQSVLFLPELVGLACGMNQQQVGLDWHLNPVRLHL